MSSAVKLDAGALRPLRILRAVGSSSELPEPFDRRFIDLPGGSITEAITVSCSTTGVGEEPSAGSLHAQAWHSETARRLACNLRATRATPRKGGMGYLTGAGDASSSLLTDALSEPTAGVSVALDHSRLSWASGGTRGRRRARKGARKACRPHHGAPTVGACTGQAPSRSCWATSAVIQPSRSCSTLLGQESSGTQPNIDAESG